MTVRNLEFMFKPESLALIGADEVPGSLGSVLLRNLLEGGFKGDILPVNPRLREIHSLPCHKDIASLPKTPDLAVLTSVHTDTPSLVAELGARGTRAAIIHAGLRERRDIRCEDLRAEILRAAKPHLLRILGPNTLGIMVPGSGLNASFSHIQPIPGTIAFVGQSGAIQTSVLDWAASRNIGFSHFIALGDMLDIDFGDILDYLANDPSAKAILIYMEMATHARKFMSAARAAARMKPVIVVKAGRHAEAARAAATHTGAMAGSDAVYDAVFRRAGMLRVYDLHELFDAVETLATVRPPYGNRLAIVTNGGGLGVLTTDSLLDEGGRLAELSPETLTQLDAGLDSSWSRSNPVDIGSHAPAERYASALPAILGDDNCDAVLVLNSPNAMVSSLDAARAVTDAIKRCSLKGKSRPVLTSWLGGETASAARKLFSEERVPTYDTPASAVRGFMQLIRYRRNQEMLMETPPSIPEVFSPDMVRAREIISRVVGEGREFLSEIEAKAVLEAYRIPVVPSYQATTPEEAAELARSIGIGFEAPVALKIVSPDIAHKHRAGGVALNLRTPELVRKASLEMLETIATIHPTARIEGFTVQPMACHPHSCELIAGMVSDSQFGPVILFGHGGTNAELIRDWALALPPLNMVLARELIGQTRVYSILKGNHDCPCLDIEAIALTLVKISQLICDIADIAELDINPLLACENHVMALDAKIKLSPTGTPAPERLAIRPYPKELEEIIPLPDGPSLTLRPVRPEDEPAYLDFFDAVPPEDIRLRFLHPMKTLPHSLAARLTQIDYDREMALVLVGEGASGEMELYGDVRISADPDNERGEFAIMLRREFTGSGLGPTLMRRIIEYSRKRGMREIYGEVLSENVPMLRLCKALGFTIRRDPEEPGVMTVSMGLRD